MVASACDPCVPLAFPIVQLTRSQKRRRLTNSKSIAEQLHWDEFMHHVGVDKTVAVRSSSEAVLIQMLPRLDWYARVVLVWLSLHVLTVESK